MKIRNLNTLFAILVFFILLACEKNTDNLTETTNEKIFRETIAIENTNKKYSLGDTIWFSANFNNQLTDSKSQEVIVLENQTFMLRGTVNLLKPKFDTIPFVYQNFDLIEDLGTIHLINVFNTEPQAYTFDIKFGRPLLTNEVRFGLVLKYLGIFAIEYESWVFYGSSRVDYNDFSLDNEKGYLNLSFDTDIVNDSIFNALPTDYRYYFQSYYNSGDIAANKFYFFETDND